MDLLKKGQWPEIPSLKILRLTGLTLLYLQMLLESTPIPLPPSDGTRDYKDYKH